MLLPGAERLHGGGSASGEGSCVVSGVGIKNSLVGVTQRRGYSGEGWGSEGLSRAPGSLYEKMTLLALAIPEI